uniref:Ubiquitin-like domain-containing protein n=1 Tax=Chromera velia CCMP2878 TaxID=1169474 RepID=A0A0G4GFC9_9ALVE
MPLKIFFAEKGGAANVDSLALDPKHDTLAQMEALARGRCLENDTWYVGLKVFRDGKMVSWCPKKKIDFYLGCSFHVQVCSVKKLSFVEEEDGEWVHRQKIDAKPSDTGESLKAKIRSSVEVPQELQYLMTLDGQHLADNTPLSKYDFGTNASVHLQLSPVPNSDNALIWVFVHTLTGKIVDIPMNICDDVLTLKEKIQDKEGIPPEQLRLIYEGKQLEDARTLLDYGATSECTTIHMVLRLRGGHIPPTPFVDVRGALRVQQFSDSAPSWRTVRPGLNLHGKCKNRNCRAYGHQVIMPQGMESFDFILSSADCTCPECGIWTQPETCGFYKCQWSHEAIFLQGPGTRPETIRGDWQSAIHKAYQRFEEGTQSLNYVRLVFFMRELDEADECCVCFEGLHRDVVTPFACRRHRFHHLCVQGWLENATNTCPLCRAAPARVPA